MFSFEYLNLFFNYNRYSTRGLMKLMESTGSDTTLWPAISNVLYGENPEFPMALKLMEVSERSER